MVSAVGSLHRHVPLKPENPDMQAGGKCIESVGHRAKAQVVANVDTAQNAQGKAAAMLAKLDLSAIPALPIVDGGEGSTTTD